MVLRRPCFVALSVLFSPVYMPLCIRSAPCLLLGMWDIDMYVCLWNSMMTRCLLAPSHSLVVPLVVLQQRIQSVGIVEMVRKNRAQPDKKAVRHCVDTSCTYSTRSPPMYDPPADRV